MFEKNDLKSNETKDLKYFIRIKYTVKDSRGFTEEIGEQSSTGSQDFGKNC